MGNEKLLWTTGVTVNYQQDKDGTLKWVADCTWKDRNLLKDGCIEGKIQTRYYEESLEKSIDSILEMIRRFDIKLCTEIPELLEVMGGFDLYCGEDDGENWSKEAMLKVKEEAERRMWRHYCDDIY
jgi:hypothetical protein